MGALAAAVAGKATGVGAADTGATAESPGSAESLQVENYANRAGRVDTEGFNDALNDYSNGVINSSEFNSVKTAWQNGERVVNKEVIQLSDNISSDTTLEKNPNNPSGEAVVYQVTSHISVSAQLTLEAGVVMEFTQGTELNIGSNGTIIGEGTSQDPILFTATNARPGWWNGIDVESSDLDNILTQATIEYGGRNLNGCIDVGGASIQLTDCTVRHGQAYGLSLGNNGELLSGSDNNTYTRNLEGAAYARTSTMHMLSAGSSYTGNSDDYVFVNSQNISGAGPDSESRTWAALDVPWRMDGGHQVDEMALDIEAGATFEFTQQSSLFFQNNARMLIEGTADSKITFTGTSQQRGWWDGIYAETTDTENVMDHVVAEYGGNGRQGTVTLATDFGESAELQFTNCTVRHSGQYGLYCGSNVTLTNTGSNEYTGNTNGPVHVQAPTMHMLSDTSTFTGNDNDYVHVSTNNINLSGPEESITWQNIDVPWRIDGSLTVNNVELIVNGGATFEFTESSNLFFDNNAVINMVGIEEIEGQENPINEITFTGTDEQRGWWDGIYAETTNTDNTMEWVIVEYGGDDRAGNLTLATDFGESAELKLRQCTFRHSAGHGLYCGSNVTLKETGFNEYTSNALGPVRVQAPTMHMLSDNSTFTGNDEDYVLVSTNNISGPGSEESIRWDNIDVPWRIDGELQVNNYELIVDPGANFEFTEASRLRFENGAVMTIDGTESDPITFTGTDDQRGWWDGIYLETQSLLNTMSHTVIEYGANNLDGNLEVGTDFGEAGNIELNNCTFRHGDGYGLKAGSDTSFPNSGSNVYTNNVSGAADMRAENIHYLSADSDFTGNDTDIVLVRDSNLGSGDLASGQDTATWDAINVPYEFTSNTDHTISDVELVIEPGATLQFREQSKLEFDTGSIITIEGTSDNPITITGTEQIKGWWDGIYIRSESLLNTIDNTIVEYGGRETWDDLGIGANIAMGLEFGDNATLTLTNSTLRHSSGAGLFADPGDVPENDADITSVNTFSDNDGGGYVLDN